MKRITLAPGAHVTVLPAEKFNRCRISINFIWRASKERATAEAVLPLVLERGYADCPDMTELSKRLARLYGAALSVDGTMSGQNRILTVSVSGIKDRFALENEALSREYADIAFGTAFRPYIVNGVLDGEAVAIEKEQLRELLVGEINEKRSYCIRQTRRRLYADSPAGVERNGYIEELDGLTAEDVTAAYRHMLRHAQIEVYVLGAQEEEVQRSLCAALEGVERTPDTLPQAITFPKETPEYYEEPMATVQGKLCMMFTPKESFRREDLSALRVASAIFGGLPTSRLFQNVREKQGLCYYCASSFTSLTNVLCVDSGIEHGNAQKTQQSILHELAEISEKPVSQQELQEAKLALTNQLAAVGDSLRGLESWYFSERMRGGEKTPQEVAREVEAVTAQDVQRIMSRFSLAVSYTLTKEEPTDE